MFNLILWKSFIISYHLSLYYYLILINIQTYEYEWVLIWLLFSETIFRSLWTKGNSPSLQSNFPYRISIKIPSYGDCNFVIDGCYAINRHIHFLIMFPLLVRRCIIRGITMHIFVAHIQCTVFFRHIISLDVVVLNDDLLYISSVMFNS